MTRRSWCLGSAGMAASRLLGADPAGAAWDVIASAVRALAGGNAAEFLGYFDRSMQGYQTFRSNVTALVAEADVQSSIDLVRNDGDEHSRAVELDWMLRIAP